MIWWCVWYRRTSRRASFCSGVRSDLYLGVPAKVSSQLRPTTLRTLRYDSPLRKDEEGLVPQNRHLSLVTLEAQEVEDESVDDLVRQGVLLVEQNADKQTVGAYGSIARLGAGRVTTLSVQLANVPVYSISASLRRAAPEWSTGTETLVKTEPRMAASRRVQVPLCRGARSM